MDEAKKNEAEFKKNQRLYSKFVAKYWADKDFQARVHKDPNDAMKAFGFEIDPKLKLVPHEFGEDEVMLMIPRKSVRFSEFQLEAFEAHKEGTFFCAGSAGTFGTLVECFGTFFCLGSLGTQSSCIGGDDDEPKEPDDDDDDGPDDTETSEGEIRR